MNVNKKLEKHKIDKDFFIKVSKESSSATQAAALLNLSFSTYKRIAIELYCYNTNQSGKGMAKKSGQEIPLEEILEGKHPQYTSDKLKKKLYKEGLKENKCEECGISEWNNKKIICELHHKDGNSNNHKFENLQILCPNCHSQTDLFRGRFEKTKISVEDKILIEEKLKSDKKKFLEYKKSKIKQKKQKEENKRYCLYCNKELNSKKQTKYCSQECSHKDKKSIIYSLDLKEIKDLFINNNFSFKKIGNVLNISDKSVKSFFIKKYNLNDKQDIINFIYNI